MNKLGKSNIQISALTLGCMSLGINNMNAHTIIDRALDAGINHLDTADLYDFGRNEEIVGEAIKKKRNEIVITTKVGNHFNTKDKNWYWDPSKAYIHKAVRESLQRLKTDYIDVYLLHGGTIDDPIDETIEAFEELKKEGLIRAYGISSIRPNVIREYVKRSNIDAVMMQYNLFDRRPEEEMLDLLYANEISVLARGPLAKGMLSNHGLKQMERKGKDGYLEYSVNELKHIVQSLDTNYSNHVNQIAIQYVLKHPAVASAVFGASSIEQLEENMVDLDDELRNTIYKDLKQLSKPIKYVNHR